MTSNDNILAVPLRVDLLWAPKSDIGPALFAAVHPFLARQLPGSPHPGNHSLALRTGIGIDLRGGRALAEAVADTSAAIRLVVPVLDKAGRLDDDWRAGVVAFARQMPACFPILEEGVADAWRREPWGGTGLPRGGTIARSHSAVDQGARVARALGLALCLQMSGRPEDGGRAVRVYLGTPQTPSGVAIIEAILQYFLQPEHTRVFLTEALQSTRGTWQPERDAGHGVFVRVQSDEIGANGGAQDEVLAAKRAGLALITLVDLKGGEARIHPYAGNGPSIVWREGAEVAVFDECLRMTLHALHFKMLAEALDRSGRLPARLVHLSHPPELVDLMTDGSSPNLRAMVLHPDPPLSRAEEAILNRARPRLQMATPTTLRVRLEELGAPPALGGLVIALSASSFPGVPSPTDAPSPSQISGLTLAHAQELTALLTLGVVRAGARLGYGGDGRRGGVTEQLVALLADHVRPDVGAATSLVTWPRVPFTDDENEVFFAQTDIRPVEDGAWPQQDADTSRRLWYSLQRARMGADVHGRVLVGGKDLPSPVVEGGYDGRFPGVLEEAWRTLRSGRALYILGGFGGCAAAIAHLAKYEDMPHVFDDTSLAAMAGGADWAQRAESLAAALAVHVSDVPATIRAMAEEVRALWRGGGAAANGLSPAENEALLVSTHPLQAVLLVLRGLTRVARLRSTESPVQLTLFPGNILDAPEVSAYAVALIDGLPPTGATAALDKRLSSRLSAALRDGAGRAGQVRHLVVEEDALVGGSVVLLGLGTLEEVRLDAAEVVRGAVEGLGRFLGESDLRSVALVTFGTGIGLEARTAVSALFDGFKTWKMGDRAARVVICEAHRSQFDAVRETLEERRAALSPGIELAPLPSMTQATAPSGGPTWVDVRGGEGRVVTSVRASNDLVRAVQSSDARPTADVARLISWDRPTAEALEARGRGLAEALGLTTALAGQLEKGRLAPLAIAHDVDWAGLPYEALLLGPLGSEWRPALVGGVVRQLIGTRTPPPRRSESRARFRVLLVADPTRNLEAAKAEGKALERYFGGRPDVELERLEPWQAGPSALLEKLGSFRPHLFHYAGHAGSTRERPDAVGLHLPGGWFGPESLACLEKDGWAPLVVFLNACTSAAVAAAPGLARSFLEAGTSAFIGTSWPVASDVAARMSEQIYLGIQDGLTVSAAVTKGRRVLFKEGALDWANFVLYGDTLVV